MLFCKCFIVYRLFSAIEQIPCKLWSTVFLAVSRAIVHYVSQLNTHPELFDDWVDSKLITNMVIKVPHSLKYYVFSNAEIWIVVLVNFVSVLIDYL